MSPKNECFFLVLMQQIIMFEIGFIDFISSVYSFPEFVMNGLEMTWLKLKDKI